MFSCLSWTYPTLKAMVTDKAKATKVYSLHPNKRFVYTRARYGRIIRNAQVAPAHTTPVLNIITTPIVGTAPMLTHRLPAWHRLFDPVHSLPPVVHSLLHSLPLRDVNGKIMRAIVTRVVCNDIVTVTLLFDVNHYRPNTPVLLHVSQEAACRLHAIYIRKQSRFELCLPDNHQNICDWLLRKLLYQRVWVKCGDWNAYGHLVVTIYIIENALQSGDNTVTTHADVL